MIGLAVKNEWRQIAAEFFELFKTPWEEFDEASTYSVVLTNHHQRFSVNAKLIIVFSDKPTEWDMEIGVKTGQSQQGCTTRSGDSILPIYCNVSPLYCDNTGFLEIDGVGLPAAVRIFQKDRIFVRVGFDLFAEVNYLITKGQPVYNSYFPTLERHIELLRTLIIGAGIPLVEIPPVPIRHQVIVCLTHDIDFIGIRQHVFDYTFFGFLYRATIGSLLKFWRKLISFRTVLKNFKAVASIPFIFLGWARDFWFAFEKYLGLEKGLSATYFICPIRNTVGDNVAGPRAYRRAMRYDIDDVSGIVQKIISQGHEVGVHGINSWCNAEKGKKELERISKATGNNNVGIRMHWLCYRAETPSILENAGYIYDSTCGYNDAVGFKAGTAQVYVPPGARHLMELPLHLQDTALFYPGRMALSFEKGLELFHKILNSILQTGGVFTILWHDRSLVPERLWEEPYKHILQELKKHTPWFATAGQATRWFRKRRSATFGPCIVKEGTVSTTASSIKDDGLPSMKLRVYFPDSCIDSRPYIPFDRGHHFREIELPASGEFSIAYN